MERGFSNPRLSADKNVRAPMSAGSEGRHAGRPYMSLTSGPADVPAEENPELAGDEDNSI